MDKVLLTGGAGFLGSHLVEFLVSRVGVVRVLDDLSTGRLENLEHLRGQFEIIQGSIADPSAALAACKDVEVVFHLGAIPSVPRSIEDPLRTNHSNVTGTLTLLLAARDAGVRRLIYSGSSSVYGSVGLEVQSEEMCPHPRSPYAVSKYCAEQYCEVVAGLYGLETVTLRYFNIFGPRQLPGSAYGAVIPRFIRRMMTGHSPVVEGTGKQSRDFTYAENAVSANWLAAHAPGVSGECFNVGCGSNWTLLQLIAELNRILETDLEPDFVAPRAGDMLASCAAIGKAEQRLGYKPLVSVPEGLERTVEWTRQCEEQGLL